MDELLESFARYEKAKKAMQVCRDGCDYDANYFCFMYEEAINSAKADAGGALVSLIDARIRELAPIQAEER